MELSIPYEITGPDGTRVVVGNSNTAKADPDWIGWLDPENGISISREIRQSAEDATDVEGGYHGLFHRGRATINLQGSLDPTLGITATETKLQRATRALRTDALFKFTPTGYPTRAFWVRLAQDPVFSGRRPKQFNAQLVSQRPYALSPEETTRELVYDTMIVSDPVAMYWRLGETAGTNADDRSTNNRDGTYTGGVTLNQTGALTSSTDKAILLDGVNARVTSTFAAFATAERTFEGWAKRNHSGGHDTLFGGDTANNPLLRLSSGNNDVRWWPDSTAGSVTWTNAWPGNGVWVHWALAYNNTTRASSLYINGDLVSTQTPVTPYSGTPGNFQVGAHGSGTDFFVGYMDEVAVYSGLLTAARIQEHYDVGKGIVTNAGTYDTWPRFKITGPITNPVITNSTAGQTIRFTVTLASGEYINVYPDPLAPAAVLFGPSQLDRYSYYDRTNSRWWQLEPGDNSLTYSASSISNGASILAYWRDAWD